MSVVLKGQGVYAPSWPRPANAYCSRKAARRAGITRGSSLRLRPEGTRRRESLHFAMETSSAPWYVRPTLLVNPQLWVQHVSNPIAE